MRPRLFCVFRRVKDRHKLQDGVGGNPRIRKQNNDIGTPNPD